MFLLTLLALQATLVPGDTAQPIGIRFVPPTVPSPGYLALTAEPASLAEIVTGDTLRRKAFVYTDAYATRLTIHKWASWAMLPLFAGEYVVGQQLYNDPQSDLRDLHSTLATGIGALFAVNTVTGGWNLWEARHDPNGRTRRWVHSITMMVAEAGFVATAATAPHSEDGFEESGGDKNLHRTLAISSGSLALASWLMMLVWKD